MRREVTVDELRISCQQMEERLARQASELQLLSERLAAADDELERYAYVVSHDLKEPLRTITGFSTLLQRRLGDSLGDDARQYLDLITAGAQRMQLLIDALLDYSRAGRAQQPSQPVALDALLSSVLIQLGPAIDAAGADVAAAPLPMVQGDPARLELLLRLLLDNALKFRAEAPPQIGVQAEDADDHWLVSVADNGIGIAPGQQQRIFEVFQRLHARDEYPGTGIGLAIARKIVDSHGGRLWVESEPGRGAVFFFTLPKSPETATAA